MEKEQECHLEELESVSVAVSGLSSIIIDLRSLILATFLWGEFIGLIRYITSIGPLKKLKLGEHIDRRKNRKSTNCEPIVLNLQPGEIVEVLSYEEIVSSLDNSGQYQGLGFMPEMRKFCGKRFKVLKRVDKMIIEGKGMRRLRPTVFLDGVFCDGQAHGGCQRTCYCFWREGWLKRVRSPRILDKPRVGVEPT